MMACPDNHPYIKIRGEWKYLYRAIDKQGNTIDFLLTAKRDKKVANPVHVRLQIVPVRKGDLGWNRTLAHVEERSKQELAVGMGTVLRVGPDRVPVPWSGEQGVVYFALTTFTRFQTSGTSGLWT